MTLAGFVQVKKPKIKATESNDWCLRGVWKEWGKCFCSARTLQKALNVHQWDQSLHIDLVTWLGPSWASYNFLSYPPGKTEMICPSLCSQCSLFTRVWAAWFLQHRSQESQNSACTYTDRYMIYNDTERERYIYIYILFICVCVHPLSFICLEEPCTVNYSKSWLMATHTMARLAKASRWHPCQLSPLAAAVFECQSGGRAGC